MGNIGTPLGKMVVEMDLNSSNFNKSLTGLKRSLKASESQMKAQMSIFDTTGDRLGKLGAKYDGLNRSIKLNQEHINDLTAAYKKEVAANSEMSAKAQNLAKDINNAVSKQALLEKQLKATSAQMKIEKLNIQELNNQMQANTRLSDATARKYTLTGNKLGAIRAQYSGLESKIASLNKIRDAEKQKLAIIESANGKASSAYVNQKARITELDNEILVSTQKMNTYAKQIGGLSPRFDNFRNSIDATAQKFRVIGDKAIETGRNVTTHFSAPLALGIGIATKNAADFEQQMSNTLSVMAPDEVNKYREALKKLAIQQGADTKYSALEAAKAQEELLKAGVSVKDVIHGGLSGALSLATAGEIDLASAAEVAATVLNAFRDDNLSVADAADILAGAANASATGVSELKESLAQVSAIASGVGMSFKDTSTALAVFAQNGLKGSDAGTSLKTMLARLTPMTDNAYSKMDSLGLIAMNAGKGFDFLTKSGMKPASKSTKDIYIGFSKLAEKITGAKMTTAKTQKAFKQLTVTSGALHSAFYDNNGELRSLEEIAGTLKKSMSGLNREQRQQAMYTIFGSDAQRGANILFREGATGVKNMKKEMGKVTAEQVAKQKMDNLKGSIEELSGAAETLAISAGETLIPMFRDVVKEAQKWLDKFNDLDEGTKKFITKIVLIGAVAGPAIMAFGGVARGISSIYSVIGATTNGISRLIGFLDETTRVGRNYEAGMTVVSAATSGAGQKANLTGRLFGGLTKSAKGVSGGVGLATRGVSLFGLTLNPIGLSIAGVGLALAGSYAAWKIWGEKAYESAERTRKWGTDVGAEADKSLTKFQNFQTKASGALGALAIDAEGNAGKLTDSFNGMSKTITENVNKSIKEIKRNWKSLPKEARQATKEETENIVKAYETQKTDVNSIVKSTNDMIYKAMKERGTLTTDEQKRVNNASNALMAAEIQSLDISNKKKIILLKNLNGDMSKMSKMQALEAADNISQAMKKSTASFNKQKEALQENIEMGKLLGLDTSDYEAQLETLKTKNKETTLDMATKWYQFQKSAGTDTGFLKEALKRMGVSYDDVKKRANKAAHDIDSSNILIAKSSENATTSASSANEKWNTMIWDEKTGTVSTDVKEKIQEASKSNEGWNNLKFILHHADLTSDATDMVRKALIENGKWNDLNFQDKQMLTTYPSAALTMSAINDIGEWDKLDPKQQNLIAQAKTSDELRKALNDLGLWDKLPIRTKELLLRNDEIINKLRASESLIVEYNGRKANLKELLADNSDLSKKLKNGGDKIVTYNGQKISLKDLFANNRDLLNKLAKGKATIHDYNEIKAHRKDLNVYSNAETVKQAIDRAIASWEDMLNQRNKKVIEIAYKTSGRAPTGIQEVGYAKGTDFHKGGAALVNDATGSNYRELITTPKGQAFIPQGRNVLLDLPRGSAVLRGDKTAKLLKAIPKFANGTRKAVSPIFANSTLMSVFASVLKKRGQSSSLETGQKNDAELIEQLKESNRQQNKMIELLEALLVKDISIDAQALTKKVSQYQAREYTLRMN